MPALLPATKFMPFETDDQDIPSRSARKREALAAQDLGRQLTLLSAEQLARLPMAAALLKAITDYQRFPSHGAKRRQLQFIGRLMRDADTSAIQAALDLIQAHSAQAKSRLHQAERWREALLANDSALTEYLDQYPGTDVQALRVLIREARKDRDKTAFRNLLRFVRDNPAAQPKAADAAATDAAPDA